MTITKQQYVDLLAAVDMCIKRIKRLEDNAAEWKADFEKLKGYYQRGELQTADLLELMQAKHKKLIKHVEFIYGVVRNLTKAVFPERYVEGAKPALLVTRDRDKLV
jgi:hypothetical protein